MAAVDGTPATSSCLHCALSRAVAAEWGAGALTAPVMKIGRSEPLWLPLSGARMYRTLRRLLRAARAEVGDALKLTVLDLPGKSHVEVLATVERPGGRVRTLSVSFSRCAAERLAGGFVETVTS